MKSARLAIPGQLHSGVTIGDPSRDLLRVANCSFRYSGAHTDVFRKVSFDIAAGERVAILGPNGTGKSTLLQLLLGDRRIGTVHGTIERSVATSELGFVGDFRLSEELQGIPFGYPVKQLLQVQSALLRRNLAESLGAMSALLNVEPFWHRDTSQLSAGQRKRLQLYMALSKRPRLLLADEPLENFDLDRKGIISPLRDYLQTHQIALLLVTHRREEAEQLCHRICNLDVNGCRPLEHSGLRMVTSGSCARAE
jgi:ABC-type Mn2+/Zn2+ transport system ATPase subunit